MGSPGQAAGDRIAEPAKVNAGSRMIVIVLGILGALSGGFTAHRRKGNRKDIAQYAAGYAMAFMIVGMFLTVLVDRMMRGA